MFGLRWAVSVLIVATLTPSAAYAYLDAGTGSMIIQGLVGAAVAGIYIVKLYWRHLLVFLGIRKKDPDADQHVK